MNVEFIARLIQTIQNGYAVYRRAYIWGISHLNGLLINLFFAFNIFHLSKIFIRTTLTHHENELQPELTENARLLQLMQAEMTDAIRNLVADQFMQNTCMNPDLSPEEDAHNISDFLAIHALVLIAYSGVFNHIHNITRRATGFVLDKTLRIPEKTAALAANTTRNAVTFMYNSATNRIFGQDYYIPEAVAELDLQTLLRRADRARRIEELRQRIALMNSIEAEVEEMAEELGILVLRGEPDRGERMPAPVAR